MLAQLRLVATRHRCFEPFVAWWAHPPNPNPKP